MILKQQTQQLFWHFWSYVPTVREFALLLNKTRHVHVWECRKSWCIYQAWTSCNVMLMFKMQTVRLQSVSQTLETSSFQPSRQHSFMPNLKELTEISPAPFSLTSPVIFSVIMFRYSYISIICSMMHVISKTKSQALVKWNICAHTHILIPKQ